MVQRERARSPTELCVLSVVQTEDRQHAAPLHAAPRVVENHLVLPTTRLPNLLA